MRAGGTIRLAMSLLVRDEARLIAENIRYHSRLGVDCFVVTDNGSIDGSREIVSSLRDDYEITLIDEPEHTMQQNVWVNRMAEVAARELGADWVINSDADEFWTPLEGSLKAAIPAGAAVLSCHRVNMLARRAALEAPGYVFHHNTLRVAKPFTNEEYREPPWTLGERPVTLSRIGPKVMCRLVGLQSIEYGNHEAAHDGLTVEPTDLLVYHYPVRTFEEFLSKVINHGTSLNNNPSIPASIGWHVRRWYSLCQQGLIEEEFNRLVLDEAAARVYLEAGVLEEDELMRRRIEDSEPRP